MNALLQHPLARILLIAAAYFVTGKLGLLLAIPPGYATAVWPPSGIALGALLLLGLRSWPGVWLGSFITNIAPSFGAASTATIIDSVGVATVIGFGAAAQAALGAVLIQRAVGARTELMNAREVFRFLAYGGPLACLVNASVGVTTLAASGAIPPASIAYSWWTWWAGDSIGVLIFTPLVLMWCDGSGVWRTRRWLVTAPLVATFSCAVLVFIYSSRAEWRELHERFNDDAAQISAALARRIELNSHALQSIASLFAASEDVDADEFRRFTSPILAMRGDLQALAWAPRVTQAQRERFPVQFFNDRDALDPGGVDLAAEPLRRATLERAAASGGVTASAPLALLPQGGAHDGFMLALATYDDAGAHHSGPARPARGYAVAFFSIDDFVRDAAVTQLANDRMRLIIEDVSDARPTTLFDLRPRAAPTGLDLDVAETLDFGGRSWRLTFTPTLEYVSGATAVVAWLVLAAGLLLSSLVGAGALILTGRTIEIQKLVHARTEDLAVTNQKLSLEICDHLQTEAELERERGFLKMVLDNLKEGIMVFDRDGRLTLTNAAARRAQGRIADYVSDAAGVDEQGTLYHADGVTPMARADLPRSRALRGEFVDDFEMVALAEDRTPFTLVATSRPMLDGDGASTGALILFRDITESKQAERLKREFVSVVSHELRTPLTSIRASLGLLNGGAAGDLSPKAGRLLELAYRNIERLEHLVNDILDIEKIESGRLSLEMSVQSLRSLIQQAIATNAGYAHSCGVQLMLCDDGADADVNVDPHRLLQVLANLLSNAAKFSPRDGVVEIGLTRTHPRARVFVRDHGPGVAPGFHARIFEKFSQADGSDARAKPGTGLGLAISKALVERMGGAIGFGPTEGGGATFWFELPLAAAPQPI